MTALWYSPGRWSLAFKVPMIVVLFMLAISVVLTNAVLTRQKHTQEQHLAALSTTHLEGLASALIPHVLREDVWEVFDTIERSALIGGGFGRASIVVVNGRGEALASSDPRSVPPGSDQTTRESRFPAASNLVVIEEGGRAYGRKVLRYQDRVIGRIYAQYEIAHLLRERSEVLRTLVATNAIVTLMLAGLAYWSIRRMLTPLAALSRHMDGSLAGPLQPIPLAEAGVPESEFWRLFQRYNSMAEAVNEREALAKELAAEERLASLGRLASGMAHEINNPLGGLFNAIDTLKRHGAKPSVRAASLELIERGLKGIRDVVRTTLATYRADREHRDLVPADLDDMRLLIRPEGARKHLQLAWDSDLAGPLPLPSSTVRQILLNLLLNAVAVTPPNGRLAVSVAMAENRLTLTVRDGGDGMPEAAQAILLGQVGRPLSLGDGAGLGLWMTRRLVHELDGQIVIDRTGSEGTTIRVLLPVPQRIEHRDAA